MELFVTQISVVKWFLRWNRWLILVFAVLSGFCSLDHSVACGEENSQSYDAFEELVEVSTSSKARFLEIAGSYKVDADAGHLPANQHGIIRIRIHNVEDFDLPIRNATASCGCTKAELDGDKIPANGSADLVVKVNTPVRGRNADFIGQIRLHIDPSKTKHRLLSVNIGLRYRIDGLLCFPQTLVPVSVSSDKPLSLALPFICTVSTPLDQLTLQVTDAFQGLEGKIEPSKDGTAKVSLRVDPGDASTGGEFGKITITDPKTKVSDTVSVIMYREEQVTISPRTLRFAASSDDPETLTAYAVLRIRPKSSQQKSETRKAKTPDVAKSKEIHIHGEASIDGCKLKTTFSPMTGQISRAQFSISREKWHSIQNDQNKEYHIAWSILTSDVRAAGKTLAVFLAE
ncbi:MAG: DUF1573 domain-containing protein [Rubripirellula sp.]